MSDLRIVGMVMICSVMFCSTILVREFIIQSAKQKRRQEMEQRKRAETREQRFQSNYEALWMEEKTKRVCAEAEVANLKKEIARMQSVMGTVKIGKIKEYRDA